MSRRQRSAIKENARGIHWMIKKREKYNYKEEENRKKKEKIEEGKE